MEAARTALCFYACFSLPPVFCLQGGSQVTPTPQYDEVGFSLLPPLLQVLSDRPGWRDKAALPRFPRSSVKGLRYMKRLYKMSTTREGVPLKHTRHQYNTVRLFTPRAECQPVENVDMKREFQSLDLFFNMDRVAVLEHLLKSVLLYSVHRSAPCNITCIYHLAVTDQPVRPQVCSPAMYTFVFNLGRRQKWIEIDVTSFLQPLMSVNKRRVHMAVNFTCLRDDQHYGKDELFKMASVPPSLLLYLNDTSEQAYNRWSSLRTPKKPSLWYSQGGHLTNLLEGWAPDLQEQVASRQRRGSPKEGELESTPAFNLTAYVKLLLLSQRDECELHNFRLSFRQLNWDKWIIAPHRYNPHYCKGECPRLVGHRYGSPVHTMVQNILHEKVDSSVPRPSCVPSEYSPMSVLTIEPDRSIVYKEYEDMIATKCTCR
ncbi:growth/differentiation factor 9 [Ambystoma mexicanum]|uniref:growth/differentiation factor 9 n=1 Tax=Ambystoma mexicanum TaxID=8296 RepID=UPI0037E9214C